MTIDESDLRFSWNDYPPLTAGLPGTGGRIREHPEDFTVKEIPAYEPSGSGSHAYALVRKRGLTTRDLVKALQEAGLEEKAVGVAGLKDKYAVTEQWLSVPQSQAGALDTLQRLPGVEILDRSRHRNKLGVGHLKGNAFAIAIRGTDDGALERAHAILDELEMRGLPNYFGPQRFGRFGRNAVDGMKVLRGEKVPGGHRLKLFFLSALQSLVFNRLLALRLERGLFESVVPGDWARKHDTGGTFLVSDPKEARRAQAREISATLPLYGKKVRQSEGAAGEMEEEVLSSLDLRWIDFRGRRGDRRFSRLLLSRVSVAPQEGGLLLEFVLPKGSYATSLLREVMKVEVDEPLEAAEDEEG